VNVRARDCPATARARTNHAARESPDSRNQPDTKLIGDQNVSAFSHSFSFAHCILNNQAFKDRECRRRQLRGGKRGCSTPDNSVASGAFIAASVDHSRSQFHHSPPSLLFTLSEVARALVPLCKTSDYILRMSASSLLMMQTWRFVATTLRSWRVVGGTTDLYVLSGPQ
jgi:hypothetical protein